MEMELDLKLECSWNWTELKLNWILIMFWLETELDWNWIVIKTELNSNWAEIELKLNWNWIELNWNSFHIILHNVPTGCFSTAQDMGVTGIRWDTQAASVCTGIIAWHSKLPSSLRCACSLQSSLSRSSLCHHPCSTSHGCFSWRSVMGTSSWKVTRTLAPMMLLARRG